MTHLFIKSIAHLLGLLRTHGDRGATMAEYALVVSLIAVVAIVAVRALGIAANALFAGFPTIP